MTKVQITKSLYSAGVQCPKRLYSLVNHPEQGAAPTDDVQLRFSQGQTVGTLARARFASGVLIAAGETQESGALEQTRRLVESLEPTAIFEGAFVYDDLLIRVDILQNNFDGTWDLIEVKSTTEVKPEHLEDVAFQLYVLRGAGLRIRQVFLSHINSEVRFPHLEKFFVDHDLTRAAFEVLPIVEAKVAKLRETLSQSQAPDVLIGRQCANPYSCEFKSKCWAEVPQGSTLELYNYRKRKPTKFELYHQGPKLLKNLRNEVELTRFQQIQLAASTSEEAMIDREGLAEFLQRVTYPIYYFDFETIAPPIPTLTGMRPYQRLPLQFSCHIQRTPRGALEHYEFLASGSSEADPRRECLDALQNIFTETGTVIAYHDDFERSLIREMAEAFPEASDFLLQLEKSFWDLEDVFHHYYYHRDFGGSVSIKKVLPHFAPEMKYDQLAIKNGGQAQAALVKLFSGQLGRQEREILRHQLLTYCAQDSLAMVVIHKKLLELIGSNLRFLKIERG